MQLRDDRLTSAEAVAGSLLAAFITAIVFSYSTARVAGAIQPWPVFIASAAASAAAWMWLRRSSAGGDLWPFAGVVAGVAGALLWLAWPTLLPLGGGSDLTHHHQLIDFIEQHWRLPAGQDAERLLGGMVNYTPGLHLVAALVGRWTGRDGLHAVYGVLALATAIKAGIVYLIARRVLAPIVPDDAPRTASALCAALLLFLPFDYFAGSFVRASFFAQALSEMFAMAMWWALVLWASRPSARAAAIFGAAGMGAFLCWPVWIGPPVLVLIVLLCVRREAARLWSVALAIVPIAAAAAVHSFGRVASAAIVQSGGSAFWPSISRIMLPFLVLAVIGVAISVRKREFRVTLMLLGAIGLQALALLALARRTGAETPYMALKMTHFAVHPLAIFAAAAIAGTARWLTRPSAGWIAAGLLMANALMLCAAGPPQPPVVTEDLFLAGRWARSNVPAVCVEYLVPQELTAYWLHHAVLRNPSYPDPGAPAPVLVYRNAVVRWITGESFPFAIADLHVVPREVREEIDERARFGDVIVGVRRGAEARCPGGYATGASTMLPSKR